MMTNEENRQHWRVTAGLLLFAAALAASQCLTLFCVKGESMEPTLYEDDILLARRIRKVGRRDIVTFRYDGWIIIKRVIGIAGDVIDSARGDVVGAQRRGVCDEKPYCKVPENSVFLLGDNRDVSTDSRKLGCIPEESIIGKVIFRIAPLKRAGRIR